MKQFTDSSIVCLSAWERNMPRFNFHSYISCVSGILFSTFLGMCKRLGVVKWTLNAPLTHYFSLSSAEYRTGGRRFKFLCEDDRQCADRADQEWAPGHNDGQAVYVWLRVLDYNARQSISAQLDSIWKSRSHRSGEWKENKVKARNTFVKSVSLSPSDVRL